MEHSNAFSLFISLIFYIQSHRSMNFRVRWQQSQEQSDRLLIEEAVNQAVKAMHEYTETMVIFYSWSH